MERIKKIMKSKVANNSFWMILLQGFNMIIPLMTLPYITRILSASAYGEFSIALNWVGYFQVIVEYGFGLTGARRAAIHKETKDLARIHSNIICARLVLFGICAVLFLGLILLTNVGKTQIKCMLILFMMVIAVVFQQNWFFQGIAEMKTIALINVLSRTISVALIFLLVNSPEDLYLYCFLYISNYLISSLFGCLVVRLKHKVEFIHPSIAAIKAEIKDGWSLFVSSAMSKVFGSIGITILGIISTKEAVGIYSAINKIPYVLTLLFAAIAQAIYPFMCNSFENSYEDGLKSLKRYGLPVFSFFLVGGIIIIAANHTIVQIAFGSSYVGSSTLLIPFVVWVLFGIINNFLGIQSLVASGHQKEYSIAFTISVVLMLGFMLVLGRLFGAYGIAYASMLSEVALSFILLAIIRKVIKKEIINDKEDH